MKARMLFLLLVVTAVRAQDGFRFTGPGARVRIPFTLINDLVIVPVEVNGSQLNFLLDTGVDETILFSLEEQESVKLHHVEKIRLKGLGSNAPVEGLKSSGNIVSFPGYTDTNHDIYIVLDQSFNFSASIGIPVNGIIGYRFFKDFPVLIDYDSRRICVFRDRDAARRKLKKFTPHSISIEDQKPYATGAIAMDGASYSGKMLLDTGNSDAVWIFPHLMQDFTLPPQHFDDFLGRGLSGEIVGERARAESFDFKNFSFPKALIAFPDSTATGNISMANGRIGSIGGEIFKRFEVVFDYAESKIYLRKGSHYDDPFTYNMSGIEIQHEGMTWTSERVDVKERNSGAASEVRVLEPPQYSYNFILRPVFSVSGIRAGSPAEACGLRKGDILVSINKRSCGQMTLQQIRELLKSEEGRQIVLEVERDGKPLVCKFRLRSMI